MTNGGRGIARPNAGRHGRDMGNRSISVPDDVHELLRRQKLAGESLGDLLRRRLQPPADRCGEVLERLDELDPHLAGVELAVLKRFTLSRGRRSRRPASRK
jgi:predicted CopG family antitoxin